MAYAAVVSLVHTLERIRDSHRPLILYDMRQIENLHAQFSSLQNLLENSPTNGGCEAFEALAARIRDKAYEAENLIEEKVYYYQLMWGPILSYCVNVLSFLPLPGLFEWGTGLRHGSLWRSRPLDSVINEVISFNQEFKDFVNGFKSEDSNSMSSSSSVDSSTSTRASASNKRLLDFKDKKLTVGNKYEFQRIQDKLVRPVSSSREVIPISGMGGIGKTTMARKLYDDPNVASRFDVRAWVTIKQEYNVQEIVQELLYSLPKVNDKQEEKYRDGLAVQLHKTLNGRRYLIVMDDVWDTNVWDYFNRFLPNNDNCSRVILTTRLEKVAVHIAGASIAPHIMKPLSADECWELLRAEVFGNGYCPYQLEGIGMEIASRCEGLPLVVIVIAGILSKGNKTYDEWENVAETLRWTVANDTDVAEILLLSYNHLPQHLKACFLYIGVFLEYDRIPVSKLVKLWVAEGFLKRDSTNKALELMAEEYLSDLVERNLVLVGQRRVSGRIKTIRIHDLLRDLCIRESRKENFLQVVTRYDLREGTNNPRRLSLDPNISVGYLKFESFNAIHPYFDKHNILWLSALGELHLEKLSLSRVRTLLYTGVKPIPSERFSNFVLLRVLDISHVLLFTFPMEILKLVHLRYLAFPYMGEIPESISQLYNLETIILSPLFKKTAPCLSPLPLAIWSLPKLRHLKFHVWYMRDFPSLLPGWRNFVFLSNLQSLSEIHASFCTIEVLEEVPNLKKLGIWIEEWDEAPLYVNNLNCLEHLEVLKCNVRPFRVPIVLSFQNYDFVPKIAFPTGLKQITLSGCKIPWSDMSTIGTLPNLEKLKLRDDAFVGRIWTPIEGEFNLLNFLLIDTSNLVHWNAESFHFPSLKHLCLKSCMKLEEIPCDIAEIETLETIQIAYCSLSSMNSAKEIAEELKYNGNESLRVYIS